MSKQDPPSHSYGEPKFPLDGSIISLFGEQIESTRGREAMKACSPDGERWLPKVMVNGTAINT